MKYVIITGATGGLGKAFCYDQIRRNENLILVGRNLDKLSNLKADLLKENPSCDVKLYTCDFSLSSSREELFESLLVDGLRVKRLINVAGVDTQMSLSAFKREKLLFQIRVNYEATVDITKFVLDNYLDGCEVLTVSSLCGATAMPYFASYSSSKSALVNFFDSIRYEYKDVNVKITTLMPGSIPTRPDVIEDIQKQGLTGKLSSKSPDYVVKTAMRDLEKNKRHSVPGFYNKVVYFLSKITPYGLQSKIIAKKFSKKQKDAF